MSEFATSLEPLHIPDNLTIPQFILKGATSVIRPTRPPTVPWFIEDATGRPFHQSEVERRTFGLANALHSKWKLGRNDVVCLFSPNDCDYPASIWAVHTLGAIVTPANPSYTPEELVHQLTTTNAALIICHHVCLATARAAAQMAGLSENRIVVLGPSNSVPKTFATVDELIEFGAAQPQGFKDVSLQPGEAKRTLAFLSFSSGTTGKPKAVAITHYGVIANVLQMVAHYHINDPSWPNKRMVPGDIAMAVLPFFHIYGLIVNLHYILFCGMSLVIVPKFSFVDFLESIKRHRITHLYLVPPQIVLLCKNPAVQSYDFRHVKWCMCGAAPLSGELMQRIVKVLPNACIGQGYGLTETSTTIAMIPPTQKLGTIGSAGQLIPGIRARVVKPDGTLAREGETGELVVTGPSMAIGYFKNEPATRSTFVDGWVRTGDEVIIKNNEVFVVDRLKEIIKVRGFQVAPAELEGHLLLHPDVLDACVVGIPDEYSGELPMAFIVVNPNTWNHIGGSLQEREKLKAALQKHVSDNKVAYKRLAGGVEFIDAIPKNPSGKVLRRILRDQAKLLKKPVQAKL
ncbi:hypothetical protein AX16_009726 [Volvariella volvacea WC 439]|nr:hypothetical protein AX16_009726 [Volvariella volvacea WC 439]